MADFLTGEIPGTEGSVKESCDDFFVEEIPLYLPCGQGEHLYLTIEKRGITTFDLLRKLSKTLNLKERDLGYAGLKDAQAVTRQTVSLPGVRPEQVAKLDIEGVTVLDARLHKNKLRPGHLAGNRFRILIREVKKDRTKCAEEILSILERRGVPNFFGQQRYGAMGNSHLVGRAIVRSDYIGAITEVIGDPEAIRNERWREGALSFREGDLSKALEAFPPRFRNERSLIRLLQQGKSPCDALFSLPRPLLRLYLSAYQSSLFDRIVMARLQSIDHLLPGDLAYKHVNGASFLVDSPEDEVKRLTLFEISPSGPLFGRKSLLAEGAQGATERSLLAEEGITRESFQLKKGLSMDGERRPLRVPVREVSVRSEGDDLSLSFTLPKGSYATSVLREVIKTSVTSVF